jgi:hypothetical protein
MENESLSTLYETTDFFTVADQGDFCLCDYDGAQLQAGYTQGLIEHLQKNHSEKVKALFHYCCKECSHSTNSFTQITKCYHCGLSDDTFIDTTWILLN